ncbi:MAG: transposase family protein [Thioploca sp.]|nr:transposase family protein [Thioploca sp.]
MNGVLKLPKSIPSHDTLGRVLSRLDPQPLQPGFLNGVQLLASWVGE